MNILSIPPNIINIFSNIWVLQTMSFDFVGWHVFYSCKSSAMLGILHGQHLDTLSVFGRFCSDSIPVVRQYLLSEDQQVRRLVRGVQRVLHHHRLLSSSEAVWRRRLYRRQPLQRHRSAGEATTQYVVVVSGLVIVNKYFIMFTVSFR